MTTTEYRDKLIEQYNTTVATLQQLQGAIAACNELISTADDELTTDIEADESDA